jgi:cytochrome c oxidase subunit 2
MLMKVVLGAVSTGLVLSAGAPPAQEPEPRVIRITAERFSFTPSEVTVRLGETVEFRIQSDDTSHGFRLVGTNINMEIPKRGGGELSVAFRPEQAGKYAFECSRMCGAGHDFMRGEVVVR